MTQIAACSLVFLPGCVMTGQADGSGACPAMVLLCAMRTGQADGSGACPAMALLYSIYVPCGASPLSCSSRICLCRTPIPHRLCLSRSAWVYAGGTYITSLHVDTCTSDDAMNHIVMVESRGSTSAWAVLGVIGIFSTKLASHSVDSTLAMGGAV